MPIDAQLEQKKRSLRATLTEARRALSPSRKEQLDTAIAAHCCAFAKERKATTVAAYVPLPSEPGARGDLVEALRTVCSTLYVPIIAPHHTLRWACWEGIAATTAGPYGIREPTGKRYSAKILQRCDVVFVPALAARRDGYRLGKGAGFYDRALRASFSHASVDFGVRPQFVSVVYSTEVVDRLPVGPHDEPTAWVLTEHGATRSTRSKRE